MMHCTMRVVPGLALSIAATSALADPLGLYVGAGAGQSTLRQDYYQVDAHATGWKIVAGWRPLSFLGAEIEYADLGSKNVSYLDEGGGNTQISTNARATSIFALGYLPVPLPWLDLYVKAGPSRVVTHTNYTFIPPLPVAPLALPTTSSTLVDDSSRTSIAWGAGLQFKLGMPALRVEYERFAGSQGTDSLLTAALTLNF